MRVEQLTLETSNATEWAALLASAFNRPPDDMRRLLDWLHASHEVIACGAWLDDRLVAQYACLLRRLYLPALQTEVLVGMSVNMAVHPNYRGRGLIKQVAQPVYDQVLALDGVAGVGFSNADGVKVDRHSSAYGYQVCGKMQSVTGWIAPRKHGSPLELSPTWRPSTHADIFPRTAAIHFVQTETTLRRRYEQHPFRRYQFGLWREHDCLCGVVIYRRVQLRGVRTPAVALLGAYSHDLPELLRRWTTAIYAEGIRLVHLLTSPRGSLRAALAEIIPLIPLPHSRTPYYLTVKPLHQARSTPLFDFNAWDCAGGDVL